MRPPPLTKSNIFHYDHYIAQCPHCQGVFDSFFRDLVDFVFGVARASELGLISTLVFRALIARAAWLYLIIDYRSCTYNG